MHTIVTLWDKPQAWSHIALIHCALRRVTPLTKETDSLLAEFYHVTAVSSHIEKPAILSAVSCIMRQLLPVYHETAVTSVSWDSCYQCIMRQLLPVYHETAVTSVSWNSCYRCITRQLLPVTTDCHTVSCELYHETAVTSHNRESHTVSCIMRQLLSVTIDSHTVSCIMRQLLPVTIEKATLSAVSWDSCYQSQYRQPHCQLYNETAVISHNTGSHTVSCVVRQLLSVTIQTATLSAVSWDSCYQSQYRQPHCQLYHETAVISHNTDSHTVSCIMRQLLSVTIQTATLLAVSWDSCYQSQYRQPHC